LFYFLALNRRRPFAVNITIIGEEVKSVNIVSFILRQEGYDVSTTVDPNQIDKTISDQMSDLLIFDEDDITNSLLRRIEAIRGASSVAMLLLADQQSEYDVVRAYEAGIDDFVVKPYGYQMLLAHVNAQLRRARVLPSTLVPNLSTSNVMLDPERHSITLPNGIARQLTNLEFRLMYCLVVNRGHVMSTETLIEKVWGYTGEGDKNLLKSLISRLRNKIDNDGIRLVTTVPGVGYIFNPSDL
jgi:DNA-binding response OmpR family regulator